jgi:hypothetical protein
VGLKFQSIKGRITMSSFNGIRLDLMREIYSKNIPKFINARESSHVIIRSRVLERKIYVKWPRGLRHEISSPAQTLG